MTAIDEALAALARTGVPDSLYVAVRGIPKPGPRPEVNPAGDVEPINPEFDKVVSAWIADQIPDAVYLIAAAIARS